MTAAVDVLLRRWGAEPDGEPFITATSILAPARRGDEPVMLKIATAAEEALGNQLMTWWNGRGSARVLEHDGDAVLLERSVGGRSLVTQAEVGGVADDEASRILCRVGRSLHEVTDQRPSGLSELPEWFSELFAHADDIGGFHARAATIARELLANQREVVVLHGDLHHGNVLDFGAQTHPVNDGWAAIDPKFLIGDRAFDFTNILCNPSADVAMRPGRLARQIEVVADSAALEVTRLIRWTIAWCALSSAWGARDGDSARRALEIGLAAERLLGEQRAGP